MCFGRSLHGFLGVNLVYTREIKLWFCKSGTIWGMLSKLKLNNFRSYEMKEWDFVDGVNLVFGPNAFGKTNLLEAIFLLGVGESFRAKRIEEMVRFGEELGRVSGEELDEDGDVLALEVVVSGGEGMGKKVNKRKYIIG